MKRIYRSAFYIWIVLWIWFIARELFIKETINSYRILLSSSLEEKRSYVTGKNLYDFLTFCNKHLPEGATYKLIGIDEVSHDKKHALYHLYPRIEAAEPEYLLVYDMPNINEVGYDVLARLDESRYILRRGKQ